jgi:hypothetical protein
VRTFKVKSEDGLRVYQGFNRDYRGPELDHVVLYTVDGKLEVLAVDSPRQVSGVLEYLETVSGVVQILGGYSRK